MLYDVVAVLFTKSHTGPSEHGVCSHGTARVSRKGNVGTADDRLQPVLARDWYFR